MAASEFRSPTPKAGEKGSTPKHRDSLLLCEISPTGRLLETGTDPVPGSFRWISERGERREKADCRAVGVQVADYHESSLTICELHDNSEEREHIRPPPASQVLRLAVGLLGMEIHEKPAKWAKLWVDYQDCSLSKAPHPIAEEVVRCEKDPDESSWQLRVLHHLRAQLEARPKEEDALDGTASGTPTRSGKEFLEQLELAEFVLRKISSAVTALQPQTQQEDDMALLLREVTKEAVFQVSGEMRQWLEQLSMLLSTYHVRLCDLEQERGRLLEEKEAQQKQEERRLQAERRYTALQQHWAQDKLQRRAADLLGIKVGDPDERPIFSQREVDEMMERMQEEWEYNTLAPLQEELNALRQQEGELALKLKDRSRELGKLRREEGRQKEQQQQAEQLDSDCAGAVVDAFDSLSVEARKLRHGHHLAAALARVAKTLRKGGATADGIKTAASLDDRTGSKVSAPESDQTDRVLNQVMSELTRLERKLTGPLPDQSPDSPTSNAAELSRTTSLSGTDSQGLASLVAWSRKALVVATSTQDHVDNDYEEVLEQPPLWSVTLRGASQDVGVNTDRSFKGGHDSEGRDERRGSGNEGDASQIRAEIQAEFEARMEALRAELKEQMRLSREAAEKDRAELEAALRQLETEASAAEKKAMAFQKQLQDMESALKSKDGAAFADALMGSGIAETFRSCRMVFVRLYEDALERMQRYAVQQARHVHEATASHYRLVESFLGTPLTSFSVAAFHVQAPPMHPVRSSREGAFPRDAAPPTAGYPGTLGARASPSPREVVSDFSASKVRSTYTGSPEAQVYRATSIAKGIANQTSALAQQLAHPENSLPLLDVRQCTDARGNPISPSLTTPATAADVQKGSTGLLPFEKSKRRWPGGKQGLPAVLSGQGAVQLSIEPSSWEVSSPLGRVGAKTFTSGFGTSHGRPRDAGQQLPRLSPSSSQRILVNSASAPELRQLPKWSQPPSPQAPLVRHS